MFRKNVTGTATASNTYLSTPSDFLASYSLAVISSSVYSYLLFKHVSFIRDYTPNASTTGTPKYYALFDDNTVYVSVLLAPIVVNLTSPVLPEPASFGMPENEE